MNLLEILRESEWRVLRWRLLALAGTLILLFVLFVPVRLVATYQGDIHQNEMLDDSRIGAALQTLSGRKYPIHTFEKNASAASAEAGTVAVFWGPLTGYLSLEPVPFARYSAQYHEDYYQREEIDPEQLTVAAVFEDNYALPLEPEEYSYRPVQTNTRLTVEVTSVYGTMEVEVTDAIPFKEYEITYPTAYEYQPLDTEAFSAVAVFEDGTYHPAKGIFTLSDSTAAEGVTVRFKGRYTTVEQPLLYVPIRFVETFPDPNLISMTYENDTEYEFTAANTASPLETPRITGCVIEGDEVVVTVSADDTADQLYALFLARNTVDGISEAHCYGRGTLTLRYPLNRDDIYEALQIIRVDPDSRPTFGDYFYITNPEELALRDFPYPEQPSKKGLQINPFMMEDVKELGVKHSVVNITLDSLLAGQQDEDALEYEYERKTYYFHQGYVEQLDGYFEALGEQGITTSAVLLLRYADSCLSLIHPNGRVPGHNYYGLNMTDEYARATLAAMFTFLAERYSDPEHLVVNWILGNEVNDYRSWNYCGALSLNDYARNYAQSFHLLYNCVKSVYAGNRCMISLDNCWNFPRSGAFTCRQLLDAFAKAVDGMGEVDWQIAYHAYSDPIKNTSFWIGNSRVVNSLYSQSVTMKNLHIFTDYVRDNFGADHRIILSENGFTSTAGEETQAAAIVYAYLLAEENDMVDSFILQRHSDDKAETNKGLYFGLWYNDSGIWGDASRKKAAWTAFKYMDEQPKHNEFALKIIGASSWEELIK